MMKKLTALLLCLGLVMWYSQPLTAYAAVAQVQTKSASVDFVTSIAITFNSPTTSGNLIVVTASSYYDGVTDAGTPWTVDDNKSNTFTSARSDGSGSFGHAQIFYAKNITGGSSHTVTLHTVNPTWMIMTITEYSGADTTAPLDQVTSSGYTTVSGTPYSSGSVTTTQADELLVGVTHYFSTSVTCTGDSGWSVFETKYNTTTGDGQCTQERIVSSTGSYASSGNFSSAPSFSYTAVLATFKAAAGGGGGTVVTPLQDDGQWWLLFN